MALDAANNVIVPETIGSDITWFKPGIPYPAWSNEASVGSTVVYADTNVTVNGHLVPKLTEEQVTSIYNEIIAGKRVTIVDANESFYMSVVQADAINDEVAIVVLYFDVMILTYHDDGTITFREV